MRFCVLLQDIDRIASHFMRGINIGLRGRAQPHFSPLVVQVLDGIRAAKPVPRYYLLRKEGI
jgi:hypothetical protein